MTTRRPAPFPARIAARWMMAPLFVIAGADAFVEPGPRADKAAKLGLPQPELAVRANGAAMVIAGAALGLGIKPRLAAATLFACLIPTTLAGHAYWEESDPKMMANQRLQFMKNLGLLGGLAIIATERR
jgi:putative oxidoreductase